MTQPLPHDPYITAVETALTEARFVPEHADAFVEDSYDVAYLRGVITLTPETSGINASRYPHGLILVWDWHTGRDEDVAAYVRSQPGAEEFLQGYVPVLVGVAEGYLREGKRFFRVAVGCTGGKHRSVAMSEEIARRLRDHGHHARAIHRDLGRE